MEINLFVANCKNIRVEIIIISSYLWNDAKNRRLHCTDKQTKDRSIVWLKSFSLFFFGGWIWRSRSKQIDQWVRKWKTTRQERKEAVSLSSCSFEPVIALKFATFRSSLIFFSSLCSCPAVVASTRTKSKPQLRTQEFYKKRPLRKTLKHFAQLIGRSRTDQTFATRSNRQGLFPTVNY